MGDGENAPVQLNFNPKVSLEFHGATITSDAGLLAIRELGDASDKCGAFGLGLTDTANEHLQERRSGRPSEEGSDTTWFPCSDSPSTAAWPATMTPILPEGRTERLSQDPAMRVVVGWRGSDRNGVSTKTMSRPDKCGVFDFSNGRVTGEQWILVLSGDETKEGKYALNWSRLSCHKFVPNQPKAPHLSGVRLLLFVLAYNSDKCGAYGLGNFLRRLGLPRAVKDWSLRSLQVKLIKMGGRLVRHARRPAGCGKRGVQRGFAPLPGVWGCPPDLS